MGEKTDLVVHERQASAMIILDGIKGHVSGKIHRAWIMFESRHIQSVSSRHIEHRLLTHCRWVELWFHVKVMTERRVVLSLHAQHPSQQKA